MGWEKLREQIFENQKRLGVIPPNTTLTPWPDGQAEYGGAKLPKWDSLNEPEKKMYARQAEVFAAYTAYTDYEIGRVIDEVQNMGKLDNTLIIYIDGDNGTSAEGSVYGTFNQYTAYNGIINEPEVKPVMAMNACITTTGARTRLTRICRWPGPGHLIRRSSGPSRWRRISAGPGRAWRFRGPGTFKDAGGIRTQFHHVIDIVPTILEAAGIQAPDEVNGIKQKPIEGVSMTYTFDSGQRQRAVEARHAVFRDGRQPRHLP